MFQAALFYCRLKLFSIDLRGQAEQECRAWFSGEDVPHFRFAYGIARFIAEFFRDSESKIYGWFSMGQALSLPMWIAAAILFWYALNQRVKKAVT